MAQPDETYLIGHELSVGSNVEQSAGCIVRAGAKGISVGEELDRVDIGFMAGERLHRLARSYIPELRKRVTCARDKDVGVGRVDADTHHVTQMVGKLGNFAAGFNVPQHTGHVARRGDDLAVVHKATAGDVSRVSRQLSRDPRRSISSGQVVDGADVVQTTTGDKVPTRRIGAGHDPGGAQRNGVDLVGGVGVPYDQFAVLGGRDEVAAIFGPLHRVYLGQVSFEISFRAHAYTGQCLGVL